LQQAILLVLSVAFVVVGMSVLLFVNMLNERKNEENLSQKTKSFIGILYNSEKNLPYLLDFDKRNMDQLLREISTIFFSEINLYIDGRLYATSNPFVFENGFTSTLLDYNVLNAINNKQEHFITQKEAIGSKKYFSSYSGIYDASDHPVAVLNVTHFSYSGHHEHDLEAFISTFINLYIFVFLLFLCILLYLSNQITRPIRLLTTYFGKMRIGGKNEKISWSSNDEFAGMIVEYNRMIDELEISAQRLAASEREGGWRDMAKQVAHEIKNPLTPMRLTVQQLQRTWNKQTNRTSEQIERFCHTIVQQIDALSDIANEFSYFAKTPTPHFEHVELKKILSAAIDIYHNSSVAFHISGFDDLYMNIDQHLMLRVFNNLIKNAVESLDGQKNGQVVITASKQDNRLIINIQDNGHGILPSMLQRIFVPTFTTRSSGMGLGLPMVKTIVEEHNGTISVASEEGKGTVFTMEFYNQRNEKTKQ
jgi:signal transduction histidine kinase